MTTLPSNFSSFPLSLKMEYENLIDSALHDSYSGKDFGVISDLVHKRIGLNEERESSTLVGKAVVMFEHPEYCTTPPYKKAFKELFEERVLQKERSTLSQAPPINKPALSNAQLLQLCSILYPLISIPGVCHGLSLLGVQAILTHRLEKFNLRFEKIAALLSFHNNDFSRVIKQIQQEKDLDLLAFFEGLEIGMEGYRYPFLFSKDAEPAFQTDKKFAPTILSLLASDELQENGHLHPIANFTGVYSEQELEEHFASLGNILLESPVSTEPIAFLLKGTGHAIAVGFDPKTNQWNLIDAEAISTKTFDNAHKLATHLKESLKSSLGRGFFSLSATTEEATPITTLIYVGNKEKSALESKIARWKSQSFIEMERLLADHSAKKNSDKLEMWFTQACISEDLSVFHALLDLEINQEELKRDFLIVVKNGNTEMIQAFLNKDETLLEKFGPFDASPLDTAASSGKFEAVKLLLAKGANIHRGNPLASAAMAGRLEMVQFLIAQGAQLQDSLAIHKAALYGHEEIVRYLLPLQRRELESTWDELGNVLAHAVTGRNSTIVQLLLDEGVNIHGEEGKRCPIHAAAELPDIAILERLLDSGVNIETEDSRDNTPLLLAINAGNEEVVNLLLKRGASLLAENFDRISPLDLAAILGHKNLAQLLIEEGQRRGELFLNKRKKPRTSPLHYAIQSGHPETALLLINSVADPSESDLNHTTPLMAASQKGLLDVVQLLIKKQVSLDEKDREGLTALHYAARSGRSDVVHALLAAGASPHEITDNKETAKDLALKAENNETAALL